MLYFLSKSQNKQNASYYKGLLFEELLRTFLSKNGFDVLLARIKQNSLEYDIKGRHRIDNRVVIGEAKAHNDTISGETLAAFVGKLLPHHHKLGHITGLFLSTSALSPEAEDYFRELQPKLSFTLEKFCGADLERRIREQLNLPSPELAASLVSDTIPNVQGQHLLHIDNRTYLVLVGAGLGAGFADRFGLIGPDGHPLCDGAFLSWVKESLPGLEELEPAHASNVGLRQSSRADVPEGLITGTDWLDYRHPAGAKFFIGRRSSLELVKDELASAQAGLVVELKSRSGVGKSSMLVALSEQLKANGDVVELHDARDLHSVVDVLGVVRRFTGTAQAIDTLEGIKGALCHLSTGLQDRKAVFMVDQFEGSFQKVEVFKAYEYLAMSVARVCRVIAGHPQGRPAGRGSRPA